MGKESYTAIWKEKEIKGEEAIVEAFEAAKNDPNLKDGEIFKITKKRGWYNIETIGVDPKNPKKHLEDVESLFKGAEDLGAQLLASAGKSHQEVKFLASFGGQRFEGIEEILPAFQRAKDDPDLCSRIFEIRRFYINKNYVGDQVVYGPERGGAKRDYVPKDYTVEELRKVLESFGAKN